MCNTMPLTGQNSYREMDFILRRWNRYCQEWLKSPLSEISSCKGFLFRKNSLYLSGNLNRYIA